MPSQVERRSATRGAILAAARALFGDDGFDRVTIDAVAALAGVAKGGVYHHFASKVALFAAVVEAEQMRLAEAVVTDGSGDTVERLADAVSSYLLAATAPVTRQILLIDGPAVLGWAAWREIDQRVFGRIVLHAVGLIRGGDPTDAEVETLARLVMGAVLEGAMICAASPDPGRSACEVAAAVRTLLIGLEHRRPAEPGAALGEGRM